MKQGSDFWNNPLHDAVRMDDERAVIALIQYGIDVNTIELDDTPIRYAIMQKSRRMVEILCSAGAVFNRDDLKMTLIYSPSILFVLIANGARFSDDWMEYNTHSCITEYLPFQRGVLRCRTAVVAMLRVKRAGNLKQWDKFLLKEIGITIWTTRYDKGWQV